MTFERTPVVGRRIASLSALGALVMGLGRCGGYQPGIEVHVALQAAPSTLSFDTDRGFEIRLEQALLAIRSIELLRCDATATTSLRWRELFRMPTAWAHVDEHPTVSDTLPLLDVLHSGGLAVAAGTLRPPPGAYCHARVVLDGGDAAADINGMALRIRGMALEETVDHRFVVDAPVEQAIEIPLPTVLALSEANRTAAITLSVDQRRWLDGIDFSIDQPTEQLERVVDNVLSGLTVRHASTVSAVGDS